jgi:hypothetical protein
VWGKGTDPQVLLETDYPDLCALASKASDPVAVQSRWLEDYYKRLASNKPLITLKPGDPQVIRAFGEKDMLDFPGKRTSRCSPLPEQAVPPPPEPSGYVFGSVWLYISCEGIAPR